MDNKSIIFIIYPYEIEALPYESNVDIACDGKYFI